jgi:hypothetical protein
MKPTQTETTAATMEQIATEKDLTAAVVSFTGECWRDDPRRIALKTEAAHAALQAHLDAVRGVIALSKKAHGI